MKSIDISPEEELLFCCARTHLEQEKVSQIKSLVQKTIDWPYLIQAALKHGIVNLFYQNLKKTCPDSVPVDVLNQLRDYSIANTLRNISLTEELFRLLEIFESHHIPAVPYKGPVLAASVYGDIALRQYTDLDIIIREQDILIAKELLISEGYSPQFPLNGSHARFLIRLQRDCKFFHYSQKFVTEIQWGIVQRYFPNIFDTEQLWERLEPVKFEGRKTKTFSPEDTVLILCLHGYYHCWERLVWICDIAEFIRVHQNIDWKKVIDKACAKGYERILLLGLLLSKDILDSTIPEDVLQSANIDRTVKSLAFHIRKLLFAKEDLSSEAFKYFLLQINIWKRLGNKIRYCIGRIITPNEADWLAIPLPSSLSFLYYLTRPIRLLKIYFLKA
jgi:hypothetical protein